MKSVAESLAPSFQRSLILSIVGMVGITISGVFGSAQAQTSAVPAASVKNASHPTAHAFASHPSKTNTLLGGVTQTQWKELSPAQQKALAPLAQEWEKMGPARKSKWLQIANKFPQMKPDEQLRVQDKMRDWAKLTPEQRRVVRENYAQVKKLDPNQKSEKWQEYQVLSEEEKKLLAANLARKKQPSNLPLPMESKQKPRPRLKEITRPGSGEALPKQANTANPTTLLLPTLPQQPVLGK